MKKIYTSILLSFTLVQLCAQWNSNTAENLLVAKKNSSDIQVANTTDGRTWIAFYSLRDGNYDMRAQLLDFHGNRMFGDTGILVSNKNSGSATFVFNVCVDHDNFLVVAFQVQKGSSYECRIQRISTEGHLLWGHGVDLGPGLSPYPVALSTNEIAVAWNNNGKVDFQKLSASGVPAWVPYKEFTGINGAPVSRAQVVANVEGRFSMVYQQQFAAPFYTNLYEQRYNNSGVPLWDLPLKISKLTTVTYRYYDVHADHDTTYVGYYGNPQGSNRFDAYIQRVNPNRTLPYGNNGSAFADYSTDADPSEQTIYIAKREGSNNVWAVCTVTNPFQTQSTIYVQKINALTGGRYFGDFAKSLSSLSSKLTSLAFSRLSLCEDSPIFLATDNSNRLAAVRLNGDGNFAWDKKFQVLGSTSNSKSRYGFTAVVEGQAVAVWQEDKGHGDRPYAQNITCLGHTGPLSPQISQANVTQFEMDLIIKNIYPNPARNVLNVTISSTNQTTIRVYVTDVSGNVLLPSQRIMQQGNNLIQLDVSKLRAGTYFIKAANGTANAAALFNKQ
jgi:hypothetical protein